MQFELLTPMDRRVHCRERVVAMTVRVTTLKGAEAGRYYVDGLPTYYLDAGEPAGVWSGHGASVLGLSGTVDPEEFVAVMSGIHPVTGQHLGRRFGDESVRGFDVTCSAPKSVSVLFAVGNDSTRAEVLGAHDAAVSALVGWIEAHAHTRFRTMGVVGVFDSEGIIAASFRQHTSRVLDPQLHTHVVIPNRVLAPDGRWLALDARTLKLDQRTLSAIYHAGLRAELTQRLGVGWEPVVNGIADVAGVSGDVLREFSTRADQVAARLTVKLDRFQVTMGREPTPRERWRLEREAVTDSRPSKIHGVEGATLHETWIARLNGLGVDHVRLVEDAVERVERRDVLSPLTARFTALDAVNALSDKQSTWRPAEIVRETAGLLPTDLALPARELVTALDAVARDVERSLCVDLSAPIPPGVRLRRDGRPVTEPVINRALSTDTILLEEAAILAWADQTASGAGVDDLSALEFASVELSVGQAECATAVAGTRELVLVVGPAGTGKTTALAPAVASLQAEGAPVFAVAPSAAAAQVLADETGVPADTIDKFLHEHVRSDGPRLPFRLPVGGVLIVDEAGMMSTPHLAAISRLAQHHRWRVRLIGDPLQFSAVGRGGVFGLLCDTHTPVELDRVHRFNQPWERDASLRLRRSDPDVADLYAAHGRIHGGDNAAMQSAIVDQWWTDRRAGRDVLMMAPTQATVTMLNQAAQHRRYTTGEITVEQSALIASGRIGVGDQIVTRRNQRLLTTDRGHTVKNRDRYTVTDITLHGVTVIGTSGTVTLPYDYVREHVELGYAQTGHGSQGRTLDTALVLIDTPIDVRGLYVPMTRGRDANTAYVVCDNDQDPIEVFTQALTRDWLDQPAHTRHTELNPVPQPRVTSHPEPALPHQPVPTPQTHAASTPRAERELPKLLPGDELRRLLHNIGRLEQQLAHLDRQIGDIPRQAVRAHEHLARLQTNRTAAIDRITINETTIDKFDRFGQRRRHTTQLTQARQALDAARRDLTDIDHNITATAVTTSQHDAHHVNDLTADRTNASQELDVLLRHLDDDRMLRIVGARRDPTIIARIGPRPTTNAIREWEHAATLLAEHHAAFTGPGRTDL
ncbi:MAG: MobF family relaxase, partial [Acidimicrobiia bacterium]